jgi:ubiquinone/menaquinone biosynthesis C-methylase UbiE
MPKSKVEILYDKYAKGYSSGKFVPLAYENARTAMNFADDITWHFFKKYVPTDKTIKILEAGAGDGFWAARFVELGYRNIVLSDISQGMLKEAKKRFSKLRKKHNAQFIKLDICDMKKFKTGSFDYVFSQYDAVSYCMNPRKAMMELARVAKKRANVIVCLDTKFRRVPELIEARQIGKAHELLETNISHDFGHPQYNLTWEELADYYEKAGLDVIEVIGAPVFVHQIRGDVLEGLEKDTRVRSRLLKIELEHCTNRSLVNFAGHLQMVGRKG